MDKSIYKSALTSLIIQLIIGILSLYGLSIKLENNQHILNEILLLETIVQFIEFTFYIWLVFNFANIKVNVSLIRYFDWMLTTPTMLFSVICFFIYQNHKSELLSLKSIFFDNLNTLSLIFSLNAFMLILGFLGEINIIKKYLATILGFFGLIGSYYLIYTNFVGDNLINNYLFWFNFILWSLYGVAYMFSFKNKNIFYNILDVFAKNINGLLILSYILYVKYY
jgi:hypothetical protein